MTKTMVVEGELTGEDTAVTLTTQGSIAAADRQVPPGAKKIERIWVACAASFAAADGCVVYLRLGGATKDGEQVIVVAAFGGTAIQSGADPTANKTWFELKNADIRVTAGRNMVIKGEMVAGDVGAITMVAGLVFA